MNAKLSIFKSWKFCDRSWFILYITCSILEEENDDQIKLFLDNNSDAELNQIKKDTPFGDKTKYGWQTLPTNNLTDGFYFSKIKKLDL